MAEQAGADDGPHGGLRADADRSWRNLNTGRLLYAGFEGFEADVLAALHAAGHARVRRTHFNVLRHVDAEGTRMVDLAMRANLTKAAMTGLVRDCEAMGLVTTRPDPNDGRARLVAFAPEGDAFMRFMHDTVQGMERRLRDQLGSAAYDTLRAALLRLSGMGAVTPFSRTSENAPEGLRTPSMARRRHSGQA